MTMLGMLGSTKGKPAKGAGLSLDLFQESFRANGKTPTFSEVVTHSRSGNATMVDSDGLLKWAPHNLLTYSEAFDNAAWLTTSASFSANAAEAPDGTTTADLFVPLAALNYHRLTQKPFTVGSKASFSIWAKPGGYNLLSIREDQSTGSALTVDLSDGSTIKYETGGCTVEDVSVTALLDGWYKISGSFVGISTVGFALLVTNPGYTSGAVTTSWTADGTSGIYIWGAHLYRSDLGGMVDNPDRGDSYVPTTSSAVYLPRRGHHVHNGSAWVNEGLLHESEARTNLVTYSEDFRNTADAGSTRLWAYNVVSITPNTVASVSGETTADTLTASVAGTAGTFLAYVATPTGENTFSVFLKKGTHRYYQILNSGDAQAFANFDVEAGLVGTHGTDVIPVIEDFGNGWYRCAVRFLSGTSYGASFRVYFVSSASDPFGLAFTSTGTETAYIYGAQLEAAPTPSSYIPTAGATVTRAAETLTIPSANLPWPTPQVIGDELVTNGTFDTDVSGWTADDLTGVANATLSVDSQRLKITNSDPSSYGAAVQEVTVESNKLYEFSVDYEPGSNSNRAIRLGTSLLGNQYVNDVVTSGATSETIRHIIYTTSTSLHITLAQYPGDGDYVFYDNISVREINPLSVSIQMDGRLSYADEGSAGQVTYAKWEADANNRIALTLDTDSTATGEVNFTQVAAGTADTVVSSATEYAPGILVPFNIASRHGSTFLNGATDGVALTADTTPTALPGLSAADLSLGYDMMGTIKTFRIWDKDLGDTGIEEASS